MHADKDRDQSHDRGNEPDSEGFKGGGDVIAKGGGDVIAKKSEPQPGSAGHENGTIEGETIRTPVDPNQS